MANRSSKLQIEDKELLSSLRGMDVYKPLIKLLNELVLDQGQKVLSMPLETSPDRDLALAKARMEGAAKLVRELTAVLERFAAPTTKE